MKQWAWGKVSRTTLKCERGNRYALVASQKWALLSGLSVIVTLAQCQSTDLKNQRLQVQILYVTKQTSDVFKSGNSDCKNGEHITTECVDYDNRENPINISPINQAPTLLSTFVF